MMCRARVGERREKRRGLAGESGTCDASSRLSLSLAPRGGDRNWVDPDAVWKEEGVCSEVPDGMSSQAHASWPQRAAATQARRKQTRIEPLLLGKTSLWSRGMTGS